MSPSRSPSQRRLEAIAEAPGPGIDCSGELIRERRPRKITNLEFGRNIAHQVFEKTRGTSGNTRGLRLSVRSTPANGSTTRFCNQPEVVKRKRVRSGARVSRS